MNKERFYTDNDFLNSPDGRTIRILSEYFGPFQRLRKNNIKDTIVFFGSARLKSRSQAKNALTNKSKNITTTKFAELKRDLEMSNYYEAARELAFKLTKWSKGLKNQKRRFIVTSGGGPGIMEAANRGAREAKGLTLGLGITLPKEQQLNQYIPKDLGLIFHYFFMRKFWFLYQAKAMVIWPGGYGTMDELMESLTLIQCKKLRKKIPIVLYDSEFWNNVINWNYLVDKGVISKSDLNLFQFCDSVPDAFNFLTENITKTHIQGPNF